MSQTSQRMKTSSSLTTKHDVNSLIARTNIKINSPALGDGAYEARDIVDIRRLRDICDSTSGFGRRAGFIVRLIRLRAGFIVRLALRAGFIVALVRLRAEFIVALRLGAIGGLATFAGAAAEHARAEPLGRGYVSSRTGVRIAALCRVGGLVARRGRIVILRLIFRLGLGVDDLCRSALRRQYLINTKLFVHVGEQSWNKHEGKN